MKPDITELEAKIRHGSKTAKDGFINEDDVIDRFNNWRTDDIAREWLNEMGYRLESITEVNASKVKGHFKADIQVKIKTKSGEDTQNIQVKLVSNPQGFNQVDKRWVDKYKELWNIPPATANILRFFTGEKAPNLTHIRDQRRLFFDEMSILDQKIIVKFFSDNKSQVISDIFKGRGEFSADWTLVVVKLPSEYRWTLKQMSHVLETFSIGEVKITPKGSLKIGQVGMQRKGGDGGRPSANMLQFKINPVLLF